MSEEASLLENLQPEIEHDFDQRIVDEIEESEIIPDIASEEWHDYAMRQFAEKELDNGKPIRDGLVRVTEKLIGPIARREIVDWDYQNFDARYNSSSTVHIRLTILVKNQKHPLFGEYLIEDGIANVDTENTPLPYRLHKPGTAASKAESQALRKALRLTRMVSADEITPDDMIALKQDEMFVPDEPISGEQITILDLVAKRANVSLLDFINCGKKKYAFVEQIPSSAAQEMIKYLNQIVSGKQKSPVSKVYDYAWRLQNDNREQPQ